MKQRFFADGLESVRLNEGMIRMDLFNVVSDANGENTHEITQELVMTPQSFIRALNAMENLMEQMVQAGIVKRNPPANTPGTPEGKAQKVGGTPNISPNFN